jgi:hypothetical protein
MNSRPRLNGGEFSTLGTTGHLPLHERLPKDEERNNPHDRKVIKSTHSIPHLGPS